MAQAATKIHAHPQSSQAERALISQLNRLMSELRLDVDAIKERPSFAGDIDMQGFRITNVGRSKSKGDVANRGELEDKALFENQNAQHVANSAIVAKDGVRALRRAREANELITLGQAREMVANADGGGGGGGGGAAGTYPFTVVNVLNGNVNHNLVLTGGVAYRTGGLGGAFGITGLHIGPDVANPSPEGSYVILFNNTGQPMTIAHQSSASGALSLPHNRINTCSGTAGIITTGSGVISFLYDTDSLKWIVVGIVL